MKRVLVLLVLVLVLLATGCSAGGPSSPPDDATDEPASDQTTASAPSPSAAATPGQEAELGLMDPYPETVTVTVGRLININTPWPEGESAGDNRIYDYYQDAFNVKFEHKWEATSDVYAEKVALSIASNDLPDYFIVRNRITLKQLADAKMIHPMTDLYNQLATERVRSYYDSFHGRLLEQVTYYDELYALPGCQIGGQQSMLWVRQDWLEKLGLAMPKTLEDVTSVARAFVDKKPGGEGTIGLTAICNTNAGGAIAGTYNSHHDLSPLFNYFGAYPRIWMETQEGAVYGSTLPEMKEALTFISGLYADGLIDHDFAIRKSDDVNALLVSGKCGMFFGPWWAPYSPLADSVARDSSAVWLPVLAPLTDEGKFMSFSQDPLNNALVVSAGFDHPDLWFKMRALYDSEPDLDLYADQTNHDIRGQAHPFSIQLDWENAVQIFYDELMYAVNTGDDTKLSQPSYRTAYEAYLRNKENPRADSGDWAESTARIEGQELAYSDMIDWKSNAFYGQTESMQLKWTALEKLEGETILRIVLGDEPVDSFDAFVTKWYELGGDRITQEVRDYIGAQ